MSQRLPNPELSDTDQLEAAADRAIAACGGDLRETIKLIVANHFFETEGKAARCSLDRICARQAAAA